MSAKLIGLVWNLDLRPALKLTLLSLCDHADDDGAGVFPSADLTASRTSQHRVTVLAHLGELRELGLVVSVGRRGKVPEYRIDVDSVSSRATVAEGYGSGGFAKRSSRTTVTVAEDYPEPPGTVREPPQPVTAARTAVELWVELKGGKVTRSEKARWLKQAREFVDEFGAPPAGMLAAAHRDGILVPAGWASFHRRWKVEARHSADRPPTPQWVLDL